MRMMILESLIHTTVAEAISGEEIAKNNYGKVESEKDRNFRVLYTECVLLYFALLYFYSYMFFQITASSPIKRWGVSLL
jgi:hypothetical protein